MVSIPDFPRPVPQIGWLGVTAIATWLALAFANWRIALLVAGTFVSYGLLGFWTDSIELLLVTGVSVLIALIIGMPFAVLVGTNARARTVITTFLDLMQTMPTFVYLIPVVLFFGIGVSGAVVCTLVYALPPLIRIGGYGISAVSPTTIEATDSAGQTFWQRLMQGADPDGAQDDHRRAQPDHDGGAVDGDHRVVRRRAGPRQAGARRPGPQRRGRCARPGTAHRR